jgi:hypothetical protein
LAKSACLLAVVQQALNGGLHDKNILDDQEVVSKGADDRIQPGDDDHARDSEAQKKAVEVLKVIRELGYIVKKDSNDSGSGNLGSAGSYTPEEQVTCQVCKKFTGRRCELKCANTVPRPFSC